jgi:hypothetical protein
VTKEMSKKKRKTFGSSSLQLEVLKSEVKAGNQSFEKQDHPRSDATRRSCKHLSVYPNLVSRAISTRGHDYLGTKRTLKI